MRNRVFLCQQRHSEHTQTQVIARSDVEEAVALSSRVHHWVIDPVAGCARLTPNMTCVTLNGMVGAFKWGEGTDCRSRSDTEHEAARSTKTWSEQQKVENNEEQRVTCGNYPGTYHQVATGSYTCTAIRVRTTRCSLLLWMVLP